MSWTNEPIRFWELVIAALRRCRPTLESLRWPCCIRPGALALGHLDRAPP